VRPYVRHLVPDRRRRSVACEREEGEERMMKGMREGKERRGGRREGGARMMKGRRARRSYG
jgi:hypothetical protein